MIDCVHITMGWCVQPFPKNFTMRSVILIEHLLYVWACACKILFSCIDWTLFAVSVAEPIGALLLSEVCNMLGVHSNIHFLLQASGD